MNEARSYRAQRFLLDEGPRIVSGIFIGFLFTVAILLLYELSLAVALTVIGGLGLLVLGAIFPEFSAAVLYSGMVLWSLAPQIDAVSGYRMPITLGWAVVSYVAYAYVVGGRGLQFMWTRLDSALLLFCVFATCSLMWSDSEFYGVWKISSFFLSSVVSVWLLRSFYARCAARLTLLIKAMGVMSSLTVCLIVIVSVNVGGIDGLIPGLFYSERRELFDKTYGIFASCDALMVSGLCIAYLLLQSGKIAEKLLWGSLFSGCIWGLLVLGQRSQFITLTLCVSLLYWRLKVRDIRLSPMKIFGMALVLALIGLGFWTQMEFNVRSSLDHVKDDYSIGNRFLAYGTALHAFSENPLIGTGAGGYVRYAKAASYKLQGNEGTIGTRLATEMDRSFPHNIFLEVLAEGGLVASVLWVALVWVIFQMARGTLQNSAHPLVGVATVGCVWLLARALVSLSNGDLGTLFLGPPLVIISVVAFVHNRRPGQDMVREARK
jgi:O-antigen ligase